MKILFTGKPNKGSWQIRAVQMAEGFATCIPFATEKQCRQFDFIVAVKHVPQEVVKAIRASGKPWAWDVVDPYPQPTCAAWSKQMAINWLRVRLNDLKPSVACWATDQMKQDIDQGGVVIPHHYRPSIAVNPIREQIRVIGYEGSPRYLANWAVALYKAADEIGAEFVERPLSLSLCDVVVAVRGGDADCYATQNWKSNVKLANAHGSGTPFVGQPSAGYLETACGYEKWVLSPQQLPEALNQLGPQSIRKEISDRFLLSGIPVQKCQQMWTQVAQGFV
jgi:hypothetical protein